MMEPTKTDLTDPVFRAVWEAIARWDISRDGGHSGYAGATATDVMSIVAPVRQVLISWAVEQWRQQVEGRPLANKHRRSLDDVWRQVLHHLGADDEELIGAPHDRLVADQHQSADELTAPRGWSVSSDTAGDRVWLLLTGPDGSACSLSAPAKLVSGQATIAARVIPRFVEAVKQAAAESKQDPLDRGLDASYEL